MRGTAHRQKSKFPGAYVDADHVQVRDQIDELDVGDRLDTDAQAAAQAGFSPQATSRF